MSQEDSKQGGREGMDSVTLQEEGAKRGGGTTYDPGSFA